MNNGLGLKFSNVDGKVWVVPVSNMHVALNLYQPSSKKGKLIKALLPYIYRVPVVRRMIKGEFVQMELDSCVKIILQKTLTLDDFQYAIFEGTPSVHKKMTIQIWSNSSIVAYAKLSSNPSIVALFENEQRILDYLHEVNVGSVPRCYYCEKVDESGKDTLFVQSTCKTKRSKIVHSFGDVHWAFLSRLHHSTKRNLLFDESDLASSLMLLEGYKESFSDEEHRLVQRAVARVIEYYSMRKVEFSLYHADFTPWNMFVNDDKLFVFDFEYAGFTYPPYLDWFHFFTQTSIFEKRLTSKQIYNEFINLRGRLVTRFDNVDIVYAAYLLDVISKYVDREKGCLSVDTQSQLKIWFEILSDVLQ